MSSKMSSSKELLTNKYQELKERTGTVDIVAKFAKVSRETVRLSFNEPDRISNERIQKIYMIANKVIKVYDYIEVYDEAHLTKTLQALNA